MEASASATTGPRLTAGGTTHQPIDPALNEQLVEALHHLAEGITVQNAAGQLVYANDAAARMLGHASAQALLEAPITGVLNLFDLLDEDGRPLALERLPGRQALAGKPGDEILVRFRVRGTGKEHWSLVRATPLFGSDGRVQYALNVFRDVTERQLIFEAQARLAAIVASSEDAILSKTLDGVITSWNTGAERLYGYTAVEAIGQPVSLICPPDRPDELPTIMRRLAAGESVEHYETVRQRKNGERLDISLTISPLRNAAGMIVGASAIGRNITEAKRLERERTELLEREQAARIAAEQAVVTRNQFLAMAAHELRTPLTPLRVSLQLLRRLLNRNAPAGQLDQLAARAERQQVRLSRLIESMLDVTRLESGHLPLEPSPVDLTALVRDLVDQFRTAWTPRRTITLETPDQAVILMADGPRLEQVLVNLLENARKYSPDGTPIAVRMAVDAEYVTVGVTDQGIGIPLADQEHIFERFHRARNIDAGVAGFGLGLYIARHVAEAHGGTLTVHSTPAAGSTFTLTLPNHSDQ